MSGVTGFEVTPWMVWRLLPPNEASPVHALLLVKSTARINLEDSSPARRSADRTSATVQKVSKMRPSCISGWPVAGFFLSRAGLEVLGIFLSISLKAFSTLEVAGPLFRWMYAAAKIVAMIIVITAMSSESSIVGYAADHHEMRQKYDCAGRGEDSRRLFQ